MQDTQGMCFTLHAAGTIFRLREEGRMEDGKINLMLLYCSSDACTAQTNAARVMSGFIEGREC